MRKEAQTAKGKAVLNFSRQLDQTQWWPEERLRREQFRFLASLLNHARGTTDFYASTLSHFETITPETLEDGAWTQVPVLTRDSVNAAGERMLSTNIPKPHGPTSEIFTSGTTGRPLRLVRTRFALWYWSAFTIRDHLWHNRDFTGTLAAIRDSAKGVAVYPDGGRHKAWGSSDNVFKTGPSISLNINSSADEMVDWLQRNDPDYLLTHPTVVASLARHCLDRGIRFPNLKEVQTLSEILPPGIRELAREAWGVALSDMYSGREVGYLALQCPEHPHYHIMSEGVYLEVLDDDNHPCKPGETGRVVVTTLHNYAMPLIRYEIGDYACVGEPCPCGRGLPVLTRIHGRKQNVLILPTGETRWTLLSSEDIKEFMEMAPIRQYQFAQIKENAIEIRLAIARSLTTSEEKQIAEWTKSKFGYPFDISFAYSNEIPRTKAGKYQDFISEIG